MPRIPRIKASFWCDLNVFVAAFWAIAFLAGFVILIPLSLLLKLVPAARHAEMLAYPLGYGLVAAGLGLRWWKNGLSPRQVEPARQTRFRVGHVLLAVFNVTTVTMFLGNALGLYSLLSHAGGLVYALTSFAPIGVLAGLVLVWGARGTVPAFADTLRPAEVSARQTPSAKWPPEPVHAGSAPSFLLVLAGLLATGFLVFVAAVFAGIGFTGNQKFYSGTVLPITGGVYAVYAITAFVLLAKRSGTAKWVAWSPIILITVIAPAWRAITLWMR
jgi:hypothetical protein